MKARIGALGVLVVGVGLVSGQDWSRLYTEPSIPSEAALNRLNLKLGWRTSVPTENSRDGIYSMHLLGDDLVVQKRSGMVISLNANDGTTKWRTNVGQPYRHMQGIGYNSRTLFVINGIRLYALDRATGIIQWMFTLPHAAAAPPAADEIHLFIPLGIRRLYAYALPQLPPPPIPTNGSAPTAPPASSPPVYATPQELAHEPLRYLWNFEAPGFLEQSPVVTPTTVVFADTVGDVVGLGKDHGGEVFRFQSGRPISAPLGRYGNSAYAASTVFDVFALEMAEGHLEWRFTADRLILRQPIATDEDLYVSPQRVGLYRIDRRTGREIWRNPDAEKFLAHSKLYTYALDRFGGMLILDRARGTELSCFYVGDYVVSLANNQTDRIFLAANNGLIICLHDRDNLKPMLVNTSHLPPPPPATKPAAAPNGA